MERFNVNGARPVKTLPKKHVHRVVGSIAGDVKDFNLDAGLWMPDQVTMGGPTACTGFTVSEILTDVTGRQRDPMWHYMLARHVSGSGPGLDGADPHAAMLGAVLFGSLPLSEDIPPRTDELTASDWNNWDAREKRVALQLVQNGTLNALGNGTPFFSVISSMMMLKMGVSVTTPWYPEWMLPVKGKLSKPTTPFNTDTVWHNWVLKGEKTIDGKSHLVAKVHQGDDFGDKGWVYVDEDTFNTVMQVPGTCAIAFNPQAIRWISILGYMVTKEPALLPYFTSTHQSGSMKFTEWLAEFLLEPKAQGWPQYDPTKLVSWDTVAGARHNVRVICDQEGLTIDQKNNLCATVGAESGWQSYYLTGPNKGQPVKQENVSKGRVWSTDWGIIQINDWYHIGKGKEFPSVPYVLNNPEACIRWMARMWKAGHANWWMGYTSGNYKKYL